MKEADKDVNFEHRLLSREGVSLCSGAGGPRSEKWRQSGGPPARRQNLCIQDERLNK